MTGLLITGVGRGIAPEHARRTRSPDDGDASRRLRFPHAAGESGAILDEEQGRGRA